MIAKGRSLYARRFGAGASGLLACGILAVLYTGLATGFDFDLWSPRPGGFFFNAQARSLLELRMDVDSRVLAGEGFERDGKTYTYFGILPALMRLPLAAQLWRDWTTISCVLAAMVATIALATAVRTASDMAAGPFRVAYRMSLLCVLALSGPAFELLGKPSAYVEAVLWSYAFACAFVASALDVLLGARLSRRRLLLLALFAGAALCTRINTGLALCVALALLLACDVAGIRQAGDRASLVRRVLPAGVVIATAVCLTATVNFLRWGNPLEFAPLVSNRYYAADPARIERLARYGTFSLARIPDAASYYFAPDWFFAAPQDSARASRVAALFDGPEGPPHGVPLSHAFWSCFALLGLGSVVRRSPGLPAPRRYVLALVAGLLVSPLIIMSYHYLAFRYRAEFVPVLMVFALLGLATFTRFWARTQPPQRLLMLVVLMLGGWSQTQTSIETWQAHRCTPFGSYLNAKTASEACLGHETGGSSR